MHSIGNSGRAFAVALIAALTAAVPLAAAAGANTLDVPAQYPTIQAAIVAAQPGDTVLVAPGTYVETIDFLGKGITVQSSGGAAVTTIDGNGGGSVVRFMSHETAASVLRGFTITGGTGSAFGPFPYQVGGGVRIDSSSPVIRECTITGNQAADYGGGICIISGSALVEDCTLSENATTIADNGGGGLAVYAASAELHGCTLTGNTTAGLGGGFRALLNSVLELTDCLIADNTATQGGGGGEFETQNGAFTVFELAGCTLTGNATGGWGGGLNVSVQGAGFVNPFADIHHCHFVGNQAASGGGAYGGASPSSGAVRFSECLFASNDASQSGGGIAVGAATTVLSCTLVGNSAPENGGLHAIAAQAGPSHCILWGNTADQLGGEPCHPQWCDIQGGHAGIGNLDVDPFFVDPGAGDYHLAPTSACVDAGNLDYPAASQRTDIDGDPRVLFGHVDIGADEATFAKGAWTFLGHALAGAGAAPSLVGTGTLVGGAPLTLALSGAATSAPTWLVLGTGQLLLPFKGGVMVPTIDMLVGPIGSGPAGGWAFNASWPAGLPPGFVVRLQTWIADAGGPAGFAASNGLAAQSQ